MITRVRIPATWRDDQNDAYQAIAVFERGLGPCGKTVEALHVDYFNYGVVVTQLCTCTERKEFVYPWHTVTGRIEVTYA